MNASQGGASFGSRLKLWVAATRPFSFPCSMVPVLIATAAAAPIGRWRWDVLAVTLAAVLCLHVAANLLNDYFDYVSGVDRRVEEGGDRPGRMLVTGAVTPRGFVRGAALALGAAALMGVYLTWRAGLAGAGLRRVRLHRALLLHGAAAEAEGARARGGDDGHLVRPGAGGRRGLRADGSFPLPLMLMSVPIGFLTTAILVSNNLRDLEEDAAGGVRTLAQRIGPRAAAWLYVFLVVGAPAGITLVGLAYGVPLLGLTLLSLLAVIGPIRAVTGGQRLPDIDARTARLPIMVGIIATSVLICTGGM